MGSRTNQENSKDTVSQQKKLKDTSLDGHSKVENPFLDGTASSTNPFSNHKQSKTANPFLQAGAKSQNPFFDANQTNTNPFLTSTIQKKENFKNAKFSEENASPISRKINSDFSSTNAKQGNTSKINSTSQSSKGRDNITKTESSTTYQNSMNPHFQGNYQATSDVLQNKLQSYTSTSSPMQLKVGDGNDLVSARFSKVDSLENVFDGEETISRGAKGDNVKVIQNALIDSGFPLEKFGADGDFGSETKLALMNFQRTVGLKGTSITGQVNAETMQTLDKRFMNEGKATSKTIPSSTPFISVLKDAIEGMGLVQKISKTKGYQDLQAEEQSKFINYVGGYDPYISKPARNDFEPKLDAGTFDASKAANFRSYMKTQPGRLALISSGPNLKEEKRKSYKLSGPTAVKNHNFTSGQTDAKAYNVTVDAIKVPVNLPKNQNPKLKYHTADEVAKGLALLSTTSLKVVKTVNVEPGNNPADPHWAKVYKTPGFTSYMTAGASGIISIYPLTFSPGQNGLDTSMMHETGHTLSNQRFGQGSGPAWTNWNKASKADVIFPSTYATKAQEEDFAESTALYSQLKGTIFEDSVRMILPNRFMLLDTTTSQDD